MNKRASFPYSLVIFCSDRENNNTLHTKSIDIKKYIFLLDTIFCVCTAAFAGCDDFVGKMMKNTGLWIRNSTLFTYVSKCEMTIIICHYA